ncbi:MAG: amidohydrolase family protein [Longimicrobiales bacterium]
MENVLRVVTLAACTFAAACAPSSDVPAVGEQGAMTLFQGARLIIGDGSVIEPGAMLVQGDRIVAIGPVGAVDGPAGLTTVDLTGKTVIPALIDAHAHLGYEATTSWGADHYTRENLIDNLERYAYYGFGAAFSAGSDPDDFALGLAAEQAAGAVGGARFLFAAGMAPPGQGPNNQFLVHTAAVAERTGMTVLRGITSEADARAAVAAVAAKGIRFVKIWVDDRGGSQQKLAPELYRAVIAEARSRGLSVVVHQQSPDDMPGLLDAGVTGFLHGRLGPSLDGALAMRIHDAGAYLVPNLGLGELRRERVADDPFLRETVRGDVIARLGTAFDARPTGGGGGASGEAALRTSMASLLAADVDVVLGTDAGAVPDHFFGYTGHRELEIFVRLGMTPMQALVAATSRPAARLGLTDMGMLAPGMAADFVVLDANPLDDIRNTRSISSVYLRGGAVDRAALRSRWTGGS